MRFNEFVDYAFALWKDQIAMTLLALGPPGIGKSAAAAEVSRRQTAYVQGRNPAAGAALFCAKDLSSCLPEDISGLPYRGEKNGIPTTFYAGQSWLTQFCAEGAYGVLCLDDAPAAAPAVQVAQRQIVLDRRVGENRISDGVLIIVTGNRREDKSRATALPSHFINSTCLLELEPNLGLEDGADGWLQWYGRQPGHSPLIGSFLRWRSSHFSQLPKDADARGAFATPRSWTALGRVFDVAQSQRCLLEVASGYVGAGSARELNAYISIRSQLVDPAEVLKNPEGALPNPKATLDTTDKLCAMMAGLGEVAAAWCTSSEKRLRKEAPYRLLKAVAWCTKHNREYMALAVTTFTSNGGRIENLMEARDEHKGDLVIREMIEFLAKSFAVRR